MTFKSSLKTAKRIRAYKIRPKRELHVIRKPEIPVQTQNSATALANCTQMNSSQVATTKNNEFQQQQKIKYNDERYEKNNNNNNHF